MKKKNKFKEIMGDILFAILIVITTPFVWFNKQNFEIKVIIGMAIFFILLSMGALSFIETEEVISCEINPNLKLKSVGGIEDIDSGLFSGGTVYKKDLLFENGLILTLDRYEIESPLILGEVYTYSKCRREGGFILGLGIPTTEEKLVLQNE